MKGAIFMAKILVYNNYANRMETYYRDLSQAMPYNANRTLTGKLKKVENLENR